MLTLRDKIAKIIAETDSIGEGYLYVDRYEDLNQESKNRYLEVADEILSEVNTHNHYPVRQSKQ